jgi:branched-chain amino acid transport system substrate-binding protein
VRTRAIICVLATVLAGCSLAACGSSGTETPAPPDDLTVYSALPLHGPGSERARDILDGEQLAMGEIADARRTYPVTLRALDDSGPAGELKPGVTLEVAKVAAQDPHAIAYLGGQDAAATALALPPLNEQGILQVSPGATYDGFTGGAGSGAGEPEKYRPSGDATFSRMAPRDATQARAIAALMAAHGCRRVAILRAPSAFDLSLAELIAQAVGDRGMRVVYADQVRPDPESHERAAADVAQRAPECATFAATVHDAPAGMLRALHDRMPGLWMVAPMALAADGLARALGPAGEAIVFVGPPRPDATFTARFTRQFGRPPGPWAPYGYAAMRRVLRAIAAAGQAGNERRAVVDAYLALPDPPDRMGLWQASPRGLAYDRALGPA